MGSLREGLGRLGYRSVTYPESHAAARMALGRDAVLRRPRRLAYMDDSRAIRVRQIAEDYTIGNFVADVDLPALVLERHLDGKPDWPAGTGPRDSQAADR
jgi:hypothetical protein